MSVSADLHIHTNASDGVKTPQEIGRMAKEKGLNVIAITDHDNVDGLKGYTPQEGVSLIAGVEFSSQMAFGEVHILAYGIDPDSRALADYLSALQFERRERAKEILHKLSLLGMPLEMQDLSNAKGAIGRPHIARAMVENGYAADVREAFDKYLEIGKPAYVKRVKRLPSDVIRLIRMEGAVPVLAHPRRMALDTAQLLPLLNQWQEDGLMGLEVYHRANVDFKFYYKLARERGLIVTGGSDYHGDALHAPMGSMLAAWTSVDEDVNKLLQAIM